MATVLGNECGVLLWGLAAAFGLSALLLASQVAYDVIRIAGAAVLVWMGARALWQARGAGQPDQGPAETAAVSLRRACWQGLVTNFANPKAGVFAVSFLPQCRRSASAAVRSAPDGTGLRGALGRAGGAPGCRDLSLSFKV